MSRSATLSRQTAETQIELSLDLDGQGKCEISTGVGFLDHMLELLGRHAGMDLKVSANGDLHIDQHHTTEDIGIVLGQAIKQALGDKRGITRYGSFYLPMDEALSRVVLDLSNRPFLVWNVSFPTEKVGQMDCELFREFFQAVASAAGITLHVENLYGFNSHHIAESCFKAFGRALRQAVAKDATFGDAIPSTKGML